TMNGTPVSIIIANYNKAKYIAETIRSVLDQSYENFELIIIDDCSTDRSLEIITDFADRHKKLKVFKNTRTSGANYSRNLGLRNAKGSYVIFLDADDLLAEQCLESRISMAHKYPEHQLLVFTMGVFK